jgi:predicted phosphodiesterase
MLQAIKIIQPDIFCHIGDAGEWNPASTWKYTRRKRPPVDGYILNSVHPEKCDLYEDIVAVNEGLNKIDDALDKSDTCRMLADAGAKAVVACRKIMVEGNHEVWIDNLLLENPAFNSALNPWGKPGWAPEKLMQLRERGWKYIPHGEVFYIGRLGLYHGGHYTTTYHAARHLSEYSSSIMYGHTHDQQSAKKATLGDPIGGWSIGCLCDMDKPFLKGKPTRWSHNFAIVHFRAGGKFNVEIVEIFDGRCWVYGQEIVG